MTSGGADPILRDPNAVSHAPDSAHGRRAEASGTPRVGVAIPASGAGRRMGGVYKPFLELRGEPLLLWSIRPFLALSEVTCLVVALPAALALDPPVWLANLDSRVCVTAGGDTRSESVWNAIQLLPDDVTVIAVHDAARPLVDEDTIRRCVELAHSGEGAVAGIPLADTLKQVDTDQRIIATPDRARLWQAHTPQVFPRDMLVEAHRQAAISDWQATDDSTLVERLGGTVRMVESPSRNMKITRPEDVALAEALLERRS